MSVEEMEDVPYSNLWAGG